MFVERAVDFCQRSLNDVAINLIRKCHKKYNYAAGLGKITPTNEVKIKCFLLKRKNKHVKT